MRPTCTAPRWRENTACNREDLQPRDVLAGQRAQHDDHEEGRDQRGGAAPPIDHATQHGPGVGDTTRVEEDPAEADRSGTSRRPQYTRNGPSASSGTPRRLRVRRRRCPTHWPAPCRAPQTTKVHAAPCQEPAQHHGEHDVAQRPQLGPGVAPQRDVEVVAQPAGQGHMPAPPEILQGTGRVRGVEVDGKPDPEEQRQADGDVGVAAEIAVDLHGVAPGGEQRLERRVLRGRGEDGGHDGTGHVGGDHDLLEEAGQNQPEGACVVHRLGVTALAQLREQLVPPDDRPGQQVGEERRWYRARSSGRGRARGSGGDRRR